MFLPDKYEVPDSSSGYYRFKQGDNKFRVLSSAIIGWESWVDADGGRKPIRWRMDENKPASEIGDDPKHFWAFAVWNYTEEKVQILEITQKGIMKAIKALVADENWGNPKEYDIVVNREGEGLETQYNVKPIPHKKLDSGIKQFYSDLNIKLEALFEGADPFNYDKVTEEDLEDMVKEV